MHIIIDGYNFIFRMYNFKDAELQSAREKLLLRLQNYIEKKKVRIEVVFDARDKEYPSAVSPNGRLKIVFCQDADDYIRETVKNSQGRTSILVVSEDGEITRYVKKHGAKVKSPSEFDLQLNVYKKEEIADDEKPSPESMSEGDVTSWLEEFRTRARKN